MSTTTRMFFYFILSVSFLLYCHQAGVAALIPNRVNNVFPFPRPGHISYPPLNYHSHFYPPRNTLSNPTMIPVQPLQPNLIPGRVSYHPISQGWGGATLPLSECLDDPMFSKGIWLDTNWILMCLILLN